MMNFIIKKSEEFKVSNWSGGSTTEIFIFPEASSLEKRDFAFRISSATVEAEQSEFSDFSGYQRHIMSLTNPITLKTGDREAVTLEAFETYSFDGSEPTVCVGSCTDFNVIHSKEFEGILRPVYSGKSLSLEGTNSSPESENLNFIYSLEDTIVKIKDSEDSISLKKNQILSWAGDFDANEFRVVTDSQKEKDSPIALFVCLDSE